jgi:hypothetical protein
VNPSSNHPPALQRVRPASTGQKERRNGNISRRFSLQENVATRRRSAQQPPTESGTSISHRAARSTALCRAPISSAVLLASSATRRSHPPNLPLLPFPPPLAAGAVSSSAGHGRRSRWSWALLRDREEGQRLVLRLLASVDSGACFCWDWGGVRFSLMV